MGHALKARFNNRRGKNNIWLGCTTEPRAQLNSKIDTRLQR
jgi:hypothetical protein